MALRGYTTQDNSSSVCSMSKQSNTKKFLNDGSLIVWHYDTMFNQRFVEAFNWLMNDLRYIKLPFGTCKMLFLSDFY